METLTARLKRWSGPFVASVLIFGFSTQGALAQNTDHRSDEEAIHAVAQAFIQTRDANDAAALEALLTSDVDQVLTSGRIRSGRRAVVEGALSTTASTSGRRTIELETIRFITPDIAIADGPYESVGRADGTDLIMRTSMVLRREENTWKIAAIRNMVPRSE